MLQLFGFVAVQGSSVHVQIGEQSVVVCVELGACEQVQRVQQSTKRCPIIDRTLQLTS